MTQPESPQGYVLSELEVIGRGGVVPAPQAAAPLTGRKLMLAGGPWKVERESEVSAAASALSTPGFPDAAWLPATVPGTVLASYLNAGAIANPDFSDNQNMVSDSYFYSNFWYRTEFTPPPAAAGQRVWLNFNGVNWKAEVWLNGQQIGRIEGGYMRGQFDVTSKLKPGLKNALAVRIIKNATPGSVKEKTYENPDKNGGALGADNPTFHASIGWDWIPTIRGREAGIWNDVSLSITGGVTVESPSVLSVLPLPLPPRPPSPSAPPSSTTTPSPSRVPSRVSSATSPSPSPSASPRANPRPSPRLWNSPIPGSGGRMATAPRTSILSS